MEQRPLGPGKVPIIGQGTWQMEQDDRETCVAALRRGFDLGLVHVDTAEIYGSGQVEEKIVGPAIKGRREEVFLVSKVRPSNATFEGTITACERSLARLKTSYLDSYLLHWPGPHPLEATIAAFERLEADGKIRSWGLSNFDVPDLEAALKIAGPGRIACNQVLYNLQERTIEREVLPWCSMHGVLVVGYSPFGAGSFPTLNSPGGRVLKQIATAHGVSPYQVALDFLTRHEDAVTIPKASSIAHVEDNARVASLMLTEKELDQIEEAFPLRASRDGLPTM